MRIRSCPRTHGAQTGLRHSAECSNEQRSLGHRAESPHIPRRPRLAKVSYAIAKRVSGRFIGEREVAPITAGKNPLYVSRQMGHHSPAFSFTVYGHLMESLPRQQVEWIDELVFPEGFETALNLHLSGAPQGATTRSPVQSGQPSEPLKNAEFAAACSSAQSDTWLREGAGTKMHVLVPVARRKRSGLDSGDGRALGYVSGVP